MKYTKLVLFACGIASASGQGLYNISNLYALDEESSPLEYRLNLTYGYDDNARPVGSDCSGDESDSSYLQGSISAGFAHNESNYSISAFATAGAIYYLEDDILEDGNLVPTFNGGVNLSYNFSDRIRFNSRNFANYGLEPDYNRGIANDRRTEEYFAYQSNNDIGVRWTDRFATVHGIGLTGADYGDNNKFNNLSLYNQARYRISQRTVLTAGYAYTFRDHSNSQRYSIGAEHSLTDRTGFTINAGYTTLERDNGFSSESPFLNASLRHIVNDRFSVTGFINLDQDDNFTTVPIECLDTAGGQDFGFARYGARKNLRAGLNGTYNVSESIQLFGGASVVASKYEDLQNGIGLTGNAPDEVDAIIYNLNAGIRYGITNSLSVIGSYNYSQSASDEAEPYEYTRNRYSVGVETTF